MANIISDIDFSVLSDMHKDAYGYRPHGIYSNNMSVDEYELEVSRLQAKIEQDIASDAIISLNCQRVWEKRLNQMAEEMGQSFGTILRWDMDAMDSDCDPSFYCYLVGIDEDLVPRLREEAK